MANRLPKTRMNMLKIILTTLIVSVSTATNAQDLKVLTDNLWNFDKKLKSLKQADTVVFNHTDSFSINACWFSKGGIIDSCDQKSYCEQKRGRGIRSISTKCNWIKHGNWIASSNELKVTFDKTQVTLWTISSTTESIKFVVKSVEK